LAIAEQAARLGARVILVEKGEMGGDCLNYGCVPSKALLAAGRTAQTIRNAGRFGINAPEPWIDGPAVMEHVRSVQRAIAPSDSMERFESLGVTVLRAPARFVDDRTVEAGSYRIRAGNFVICTGGKPRLPQIPGLARTPYLTNETIFKISDLPKHLLVLGGGSIGVETGQAHRNLGAKVTIFEAGKILAREDPEFVDILKLHLRQEGVDLLEDVSVTKVEARDDAIWVEVNQKGKKVRLCGSHLLVATGKQPNVADLGLESAGVAYSDKGIQVDCELRTTNHRIFAAGDVTGHHPYANVAVYHAWVVLMNALSRIPTKVQYEAVPRVTFTHPELAWLGLSETAAHERSEGIRTIRWPHANIDRALCERDADGLTKYLVTPGGRIVGAGIIGPVAGEQILTWTVLVSQQIPINAFDRIIVPYPTYGYVSRYGTESLKDTYGSGQAARLIARFRSLFRRAENV
jgi:pyruvate/2-oxoglutarate dehydrogenase complex dihydrolipoamide dehydrogenase (E3) component